MEMDGREVKKVLRQEMLLPRHVEQEDSMLLEALIELASLWFNVVCFAPCRSSPSPIFFPATRALISNPARSPAASRLPPKKKA
jgi:hypothetical protein